MNEKLKIKKKKILEEIKNIKIFKGAREVTRSIDRKLCNLVLLANDIDNKEILEIIKKYCNLKKIKFLENFESKKFLGEISGIKKGSASCISFKLKDIEKYF